MDVVQNYKLCKSGHTRYASAKAETRDEAGFRCGSTNGCFVKRAISSLMKRSQVEAFAPSMAMRKLHAFKRVRLCI